MRRYIIYLACDDLNEQSASALSYCISAGPKPISNVIVAVDRMFVLEESTPINIILPQFSEEDGIIK